MLRSAEKPTKENLLSDYRDLLHGIATAETLLELDGAVMTAQDVVNLMAGYRMITLKDENDMRTTIKVFEAKTAKKILEDD